MMLLVDHVTSMQPLTNKPNRVKVAEDVAKSHPIVGKPSPSASVSPVRGKADIGKWGRGDGWSEWTPPKLRQRRSGLTPLVGPAEDDSDSDSGEEEEEEEEARRDCQSLDRELSIMRRVFRKWCRLAGVEDKTCDDLVEGEFEVAWTKAVAPRVEGRIQMVTSASQG